MVSWSFYNFGMEPQKKNGRISPSQVCPLKKREGIERGQKVGMQRTDPAFLYEEGSNQLMVVVKASD